jgi:hypothetical protein
MNQLKLYMDKRLKNATNEHIELFIDNMIPHYISIYKNNEMQDIFKILKSIINNKGSTDINHFSEYVKQNTFWDEQWKQVYFNDIKECSYEEMMNTNIDVYNSCYNSSLIEGTCENPSFQNSINPPNDINKDNDMQRLLNNILNKLKNDSEKPKYFDLVLGATTVHKSAFDNDATTFTLCINTTSSYDPIDEVVKQVLEMDNLIAKTVKAKGIFPLDHLKPNNKKIIDTLLEIHNISKLRITNRICGTCFRSLYYMVKQDHVSYCTSPETGLTNRDDNNIQSCFSSKVPCTNQAGGYIKRYILSK